MISLKEKEILTNGTTWLTLEDIMLSEITQIHKDKDCVIPLTRGASSGQFHRDRKYSVVAACGGGGGGWGAAGNGCRLSGLQNEEFWNGCVTVPNSVNVFNTTELCPLQGLRWHILWCVMYSLP